MQVKRGKKRKKKRKKGKKKNTRGVDVMIKVFISS